MPRHYKPIPHEIDPLKLSKSSIGQKKRDNKKRLTKLKEEQKKVEENLEVVEKAEALLSGETAVVTEDFKESLPPTVQSLIDSEDVVFKPNPGPQTEFLSSTEDQVFYGGARGGGKASWVEAKVATPFGFRRMGDIKVGDRLCSVDGGVSRVLAVHPQGEVDLYKVTTDDGGETVVTLDHLWLASLIGTDGRRKYTTSALIEKLNEGRSINIPVAEAVCWVKNGRYATRNIDPYLLGVLLGDGCLRGCIRISSADPEIIENCRSRLLDGEIRPIPSCDIDYSIVSAPKTRHELERMGLYGKLAVDKCVPDAYLHGSASERLELLQGLMDTDGTVDIEGRISFCSASLQLAKNVQFLVRSLGGKATLFEKPEVNAWIVYVSINKPVFRLSRKLARQNLDKHVWRAIRSIEYFGRGEAQCITVDHATSLYITDDFIVTHNSYALLVDPLYHCDKKAHRALILRRTMPELRDLIAKSQQLYSRAYPGAKWREQEKEWRFPSGARIEFGYAENMLDVLRYQGQSYTWIGVDELPQFPTADVWTFLSSSLRSVDPTIKPVMRATGNPGNIGSAWVKEMFIDPAPSNTRFTVPVKAHTPRGVIETSISRKYIPATVFDNPYLTYDNSYVAMLASLPEMQRRQFLEGDWDAFDNAAFSDFRKNVHVLPATTEIPTNWIRFRAADWGYSSYACCLWFAVDHDNNLYVYRELYVKGKNAEEFARLVLEAEYNEPIRYGVLDSSVWAKRGDVGPSIAETMIRAGCKWRPADRSPNSRKSGKLEVHRRLSLKQDHDGSERPSLYILENCRNLIRTLPLLPLDANDPEDVDTDAEDHAYDALRYGVMSRPMSTEILFDNYNPSAHFGFTAADSRFGY